jgi:phage tail protein X
MKIVQLIWEHILAHWYQVLTEGIHISVPDHIQLVLTLFFKREIE